MVCVLQVFVFKGKQFVLGFKCKFFDVFGFNFISIVKFIDEYNGVGFGLVLYDFDMASQFFFVFIYNVIWLWYVLYKEWIVNKQENVEFMYNL